MGASVQPEEDELDRALAKIRGQSQAPQPSIDDALAAIRARGRKQDAGGDIDLREPAPPPMRMKPVVVSTPEELPKPIAAQPDATRVGPEGLSLAQQMRNEHPDLLTATAEGAASVVGHPIETGIALAKTPFKGGQAVGEYVKGGHLNEGKGRAAAIGAAQTAAMLLTGPGERLAEPVVEAAIGSRLAPLVTRTAVGAAAGAPFTPDRPAVGAILGAAGGAVSSRGVAAEKRAIRKARFEELAKQYPDWFSESTPADVESRANRLLENPNRPKAQATVAEPEPASAEPDFTVEEPTPPIVAEKGVFGGALEQHGKDFAEREASPPTTNQLPTTPKSIIEPEPVVNTDVNKPAPELPATIEAVDDAMDANAERYRASTDPAERADILKLQELLEDHRESLVVKPEKEEKKNYDFSSTQLDLPEKAAVGIKRLAAKIPDGDLAEDGREADPHITVKYGLHGTPLKKVRALLADEGPITVTMGKTSFFPASKSSSGDVVKVDIDSPDLHRLNKKIADALPHTDTHPEYKPHATIAYVKPGLGKKYSGDDSLAGEELVLDRLTFSGKNGKTVEIPLGGKPTAARPRKLSDSSIEAAQIRADEALKGPIRAAEIERRTKAQAERVERRANPTADRPVWTPEERAAYHAEEMRRYHAFERIEKPIHPDEMEEQFRRGATEPFPWQKREAEAEAAAKKLAKRPKEPVHEFARTPNGRLRSNLELVKSDGLISEMFRLLGAEDPRDQQAAIYRTVTDDPNMSGPVAVPTIRGGRNLQAEALHRIELKKGAAKRIEAILNARGLTDEDITRRYVELTETEADLAAEREGLDTDKGDTSFDFGDEERNNESDVRAAERTDVEREAEGADAAAKAAAAGRPGGAGQGEGEGTPEPQKETSEVARRRAELYHQLHMASTPSARFQIIEQIKALDRPKPEIKGAISANEMAERARAGETRDAVKELTGEEPTELSRDKRQSEMFGEEAKAPEKPKEQDDLFAMMRSQNGYDQAISELWQEQGKNGRLVLLERWRHLYPEEDFFPEWADRPAEDLPQHVREKIAIERVKQGIALKDLGALQRSGEDWRAPNETTFSPVAKGLANGVPLSANTQMYDTDGHATKVTLDKLAQRPHTRQLATRMTGVFDQIHAAIAKRFTFDPVRFGGFDVSMGAIGMNIKPRAGGGNFILLNPYASLMEVGLSGRLRPAEYAAALSERAFATIVHEIAHQSAREHDELFASYLTRFNSAAAPIAHLVLPELDQAFQVALDSGLKDDLVTVQHEVWNYGPDENERRGGWLLGGGDATASYLRPSEGDGGLGKGNGRRRLGVRSDVRGSAAGRAYAGRPSAEPVRAGESGESKPGAAAAQGVVAAAGRFDKVVDDVRKMFAPARRGPLAKDAALITREQVARMAHENEIARSRLSEFAKAFDKLSREERLDFIDRMENSAPQKSGLLSDAADEIRDMLDTTRDAVRSLGTGHLENFIANYFPHIWSDPNAAAKIINQITGKRPLEGTRSFLKRRTIPTTKEGIELGLEPISTNPVDLALLKIREMNRYLMGQRLMNELKREQLARFVSAFDRAPEGYARINDHVAMVYGPPTVPVAEAFDALVRKQLQDVMASLDVEHTRPIKIKGLRSAGGGQVWGVAEGSKRIQAKFGGDATVIMHELGHILDHRYGLWNKLVEPVAKRINDKARLEKNRGKRVPDKSHPSNSPEAVKRRTTIKKELRALADLRFEGENPESVATTYKDYVRERPEQIANAVHAYMYAKAKMKRVAPTVYDVLDGIIKGDPKLRPLSDIEPSVKLASGSNETPVGGMVVKGQFWAPEQVATIINNYLSPGLRGNAIYDAYMGVGNLMNAAQLGLSAFHLGFTSMEAAVSRVALSLRMAAAGRFASAGRTFLTSPAAPVTNFLRGRKLYDAYLHPERADAEMTQIVRALVAGGGRVRMDDFYKTGAIEGLKKALDEHNPWGAAWRAFPAFVELTVKPILEYVVPRQKMGVFFDHARLELEKLGKNPLPADVREAMAEQWDSVDNRMGQLVYDNLFWNKAGKDLAMASVRAVGWNVGTLREIGGGLIDFTTAYKRHKQGDEAFTTKMSYIVALPIFVGMVGAIYTYLATGEPPKELKDYYFPRTGRIGPDGDPERVSLPSYIKDVYHYSKHPVHTIESKLHPAIEALAEMLHNKDFYGTMIVDPEAPLPEKVTEYAKFMARTFTPFGIRNALDARSRNQSLGTQALNFIGITPAPRELVRTPAQNRMAEYLARHSPETRTPEEGEKGKLHRDVVRAVQAGDELPRAAFDALGDGRLKQQTLKEWISDARLPASVGQFKQLSADEAVKVWDLASDDEKALWAAAFRTKLQNAHR